MKNRAMDNLNTFLSDARKQHFLYDIPQDAPEDTTYRQALRMVHIVGVMADISGYSMTYKAVKYAYYSSELVNILTEGGMLGILNPLLDSMKQCGIELTGPSALLRLYYLGCYHTLRAKMNTVPKKLSYAANKPGVLFSECPQEVLNHVCAYLSPAQWMYHSSLPPPHEQNDWGSWYLSQLIRKKGWTVLMCMNETTRIPDGSKCPAFAVVARCRCDQIPTADESKLILG